MDSPDNELMERLKSVYKKTWYLNQLFLQVAAQLIKKFQEQGIRILLFKGMGLILGYYPHPALRPMTDFDILVPRDRAKQAGDLLNSWGWRLVKGAKFPLFQAHSMVIYNSWGFTNESGYHCDLHWSVMMHNSFPHADDKFWANASIIKFNNVEALTLSPEDHLLQVLEHGVYWSRTPPIRWVADTFFILKSARNFNWDYLFNQSRELHLVIPVREMAKYLLSTFGLPIPESLISKLENHKTSKLEHQFYQSMIAPKLKLRGFLWEYRLGWIHYQIYLRDYKKIGKYNRFLTFIRYLRFRWGLKKIWLVPLVLHLRVVNVLCRYLSRKLGS